MIKFADKFFSPYDREQQFNGLRFQVEGEVDRGKYDFKDAGTIYNIVLENGVKMQAYPEEIELAFRKPMNS